MLKKLSLRGIKNNYYLENQIGDSGLKSLSSNLTFIKRLKVLDIGSIFFTKY